MLIKMNGSESDIADKITIQSLLSARKLPADTVIVELNGTIISRQLWESTKLNPDDNLEIIRVIGGG